jgi:F-type H+-transporting ATPase subunit c
MEGDIAEMGKFIGAGLATMGLGGAGIGVGHIAGNFLAGALRNPSASRSPKLWASSRSWSLCC